MKLVMMDPYEFPEGPSSEQTVAIAMGEKSQFESVMAFWVETNSIIEAFSSDVSSLPESVFANSVSWFPYLESIVEEHFGSRLQPASKIYVLSDEWNYKSAVIEQPAGPYFRYCWETTA